MTAYLYFTGYWDLPETPVLVETQAESRAETKTVGGGVPAAAPPVENRQNAKMEALPRATNPASPLEPARDDNGPAFKRAVESFNSGDYETALALFKDISEDDKRALVGVGLSLFRMGDYESAIRSLEEALEHGGDEFLSRKFLAFAYYQKDDLERSAANAKKGLALKNDSDLRELQGKLRTEKAAQGNYIREETRNFRVLFNGYEHGGLSRKVINILTEAYRSIGREMDYFPAEPVTVILYTEEDFYDITHAHRWSGGLYDGKIRIPVRGVEGKEDALRRVLFHEYTHALVHSITPECPLWINEGLADYFSLGAVERTGQVIPLRALEKSFPQSKAGAAMAYRVSYSAVYSLIERYGLYSVKDFLVSLSRGEGLDGAFSSAFFITYNEFVSQWGRV